MTEQQIISEVKENVAEWLEMSNDPGMMIAGVLARRIVNMNEYIDYLERRLDYDSVKR